MTPMPNIFNLRIHELRQGSNEYSLQVRWYSKIKDIKDMLHSLINIPPSRLQLFQSNSSIPLSSSLTMHDLKISRSGQSLKLSIIGSGVGQADYILNHDDEISLDVESSLVLADVRSGLKRNTVPIKTDVLDCTGGVYFMRGVSGRKVAVFKPQDEEQGMPNNTKGYEGTGEVGLRQFNKPGMGCMREVAAYIMDVNNFCRVPPTMLVDFQHPILNYPGNRGSKGHPYPKVGSLQKFVHALDSFEDLGSSVLSDLEVQKIALLDLRLLNSDRNASNILAIHKDSFSYDTNSSKCDDYDSSKFDEGSISPKEFDMCPDEVIPNKSSDNDSYVLVPIDHGYCLPSKLLINEIDWAWFYYPQINRPVHKDIKEYLKNLDINVILKDLLSQVGISLSNESIFLTKIAHQLVVDGVAANLNLYEISLIVARMNEDIPSALERAINEAEENAHQIIEERQRRMSSRSILKNKAKEKEREKENRASSNGKFERDMEGGVSEISTKLFQRKRSSDKERDFSTHFFGGGVSEKTVSSSGIGLSSSGHRESSNNRPGKAVRMASDNSSILSALSQKSTDGSNNIDNFKSDQEHLQRNNSVRSINTCRLSDFNSEDNNDSDHNDSSTDNCSKNLHYEFADADEMINARTSSAHFSPLPVHTPSSCISRSPPIDPIPINDTIPNEGEEVVASKRSGKPLCSAVSEDWSSKTTLNSKINGLGLKRMNGIGYDKILPSDKNYVSKIEAKNEIPSHSQIKIINENSGENDTKGNNRSDSCSSYDATDSETFTDMSRGGSGGETESARTGSDYDIREPITKYSPLKVIEEHRRKNNEATNMLRTPSSTALFQQGVSSDPSKYSSILNQQKSEHQQQDEESLYKYSSSLSPPRRSLSILLSDMNLPDQFKSKLNEGGGPDGYVNDNEYTYDDNGATDSDDSPQSSPLALSAMIRVTSFSAFSSAPIYDAEGAERKFTKLRKEKRRQSSSTDEFMGLKSIFAKNSVKSLISKALKKRLVSK